jgi:hypothetical protein
MIEVYFSIVLRLAKVALATGTLMVALGASWILWGAIKSAYQRNKIEVAIVVIGIYIFGLLPIVTIMFWIAAYVQFFDETSVAASALAALLVFVLPAVFDVFDKYLILRKAQREKTL